MCHWGVVISPPLRLIDAPSWFLGHDTLNDRILPQRALSRLYRFASENTKPTRRRRSVSKSNDRPKRIVQRGVHCSRAHDHRSNYLCNPIYPSRRALASRLSSELLDSLVSVCRRPSSNPPRLRPAVVAIVFLLQSPLPVLLRSVRVGRLVAALSLFLSLFLAARRLFLSISKSNCGIVDDRPSKFNN